jgi:hypothetical protein
VSQRLPEFDPAQIGDKIPTRLVAKDKFDQMARHGSDGHVYNHSPFYLPPCDVVERPIRPWQYAYSWFALQSTPKRSPPNVPPCGQDSQIQKDSFPHQG